MNSSRRFTWQGMIQDDDASQQPITILEDRVQTRHRHSRRDRDLLWLLPLLFITDTLNPKPLSDGTDMGPLNGEPADGAREGLGSQWERLASAKYSLQLQNLEYPVLWSTIRQFRGLISSNLYRITPVTLCRTWVVHLSGGVWSFVANLGWFYNSGVLGVQRWLLRVQVSLDLWYLYWTLYAFWVLVHTLGPSYGIRERRVVWYFWWTTRVSAAECSSTCRYFQQWWPTVPDSPRYVLPRLSPADYFRIRFRGESLSNEQSTSALFSGVNGECAIIHFQQSRQQAVSCISLVEN